MSDEKTPLERLNSPDTLVVAKKPDYTLSLPMTMAEVDALDVLAAQLKTIAHSGAVGRSAVRNTGTAKYRVAKATPVAPKKRFAVANVDSLSVLSSPFTSRSFAGLTYTEAVEAQNEYLRHHPGKRQWVQIVAEHELSGAAQ